MKIAFIGVGDCGTRLVDRVVRAERDTDRSVTDENVLAFNTEPRAFNQTTALAADQRVLIGDTHPAVTRRDSDERRLNGAEGSLRTKGASTEIDAIEAAETPQETSSSTNGGRDDPTADMTEYGVGGDPDVGAQVARADRPEIRRALDRIDETEVAAITLVAGLGGGTGCGVGSVLLEELQSIYETSVYTLGVLPAREEPDQRTLTAARGLRTIVPRADSVFLVDNDAWCQNTDSIADCYQSINTMTVERVLGIFGAGERDHASVSEMRIDPADIKRTLEIGGVATIGRTKVDIEIQSQGLLARILRLLGRSPAADDVPVDASTVKDLISRAVRSKMTVPCDISSADRVLVILTGPPDTISRKGFETGRYLLEEETETVEVLAGDEPVRDATELTATVVLSNVTTVPRIDQLQRRAVTIQERIESSEAARRSSDTEQSDAANTGQQRNQPNVDDSEAGAEFDFGDMESDTGN